MIPLNIEQLIKAVKGTINKNIDTKNLFINNVSIDTRKITSGSLFIPLVGENFDGHNFLEEAFEKGAICSFTEKDLHTENILIKVKSTKKALADLAQYYRNLFEVKVVAITGSNGKTTTKDITYSVLSQKYNVVKTEGNFNNEIGLPLTIFNINKDTEVIILEMGMNNFNEIHNLSKIAKPDIAVITNIGVSHIENLGSREGILRAKYEIFDYLDKDRGIKIFNADDDILIKLKDNCNKSNTKFYSIENKEDIFAKNIVEKGLDGVSANIFYLDKSFNVKLPLPGLHILSNSLCAALIGFILNLNEAQVKTGIEKFSLSKMRLDIIKTKKYIIINDVYNANPNSMKASIDILSKANGRKVAILGDMLELGEYSQKFHYDLGIYLVNKDINVIICIGKLAGEIYKAVYNEKIKYNKNIEIYKFKTKDEFNQYKIQEILKTNDNILVKASRSMKLEKIVEELKR